MENTLKPTEEIVFESAFSTNGSTTISSVGLTVFSFLSCFIFALFSTFLVDSILLDSDSLLHHLG
jgi:hypothetical protein